MSRFADTQPLPALTAAELVDAHLAAIPTSERPTREFLMRASDATDRYNTDGASTRAQTQRMAVLP